MRFVAEAGDRWLVTEVGDAHADPGYACTAKMLSRAALSLAHDPIGVAGGFWTPASALGEALIRRLEAAGLRFGVVQTGE
jgi:saccharopine dehydrogenase (NAD+, L-glutamate forming)